MKCSVAVAICAWAWVSGVANGDDDGSVSTDLEYVFPLSIQRAGIYHRDAMFGTPFSKTEVVGSVVYIPGDSCDSTNYANVPAMAAGELPRVFLVNRGECPFAQKTRIAQANGASGVIVADNRCYYKNEEKWGSLKSKMCHGDYENILPYMAYDNHGHDVKIPAFLVTKYDGQTLKDCYLQKIGKTDSADYAGLPDVKCDKDSKLIVKMTLNIPPIEEKVKYELWLSSERIPEDMATLSSVATAIRDVSEFQPRYFAYVASDLPCEENRCPELCVYKANGNGFCALPPKASDASLSGKDIITENIRQLCVWEATKGTKEKHYLWWNYVMEFQLCRSSKSHKECSAQAMETVVTSSSDKSAIEACIKKESSDLAIHEATVNKMGQEKVFTTSLAVNGVRLDFGISGIFMARSICDGYAKKFQPDMCKCVPDVDDADQLKVCINAKCYAGSSKPYNCPHTDICVADLKDCVGSGGMSGFSIFLIVLFVGSAIAAAAVVYQKRARRQMQEEVRDILSEYVPLEAFSSRDQGDGQYARFATSDNDTVGVI